MYGLPAAASTAPQSAKVEWDFCVASGWERCLSDPPTRLWGPFASGKSHPEILVAKEGPALALMPSQGLGDSASRWPGPRLSLHGLMLFLAPLLLSL